MGRIGDGGGYIRLPEKYILCNLFEGATDIYKAQIERFAEANGYEIVDPFDKKGYYYFHTGPAEWLNLVEHASIVLTNSFHATVFSLIFNVPFLIFNDVHADTYSRLINIIEQFGLDGVEYGGGELFMPTVDFDAVNAKIAYERKRSLGILAGWVNADVGK